MNNGFTFGYIHIDTHRYEFRADLPFLPTNELFESVCNEIKAEAGWAILNHLNLKLKKVTMPLSSSH